VELAERVLDLPDRTFRITRLDLVKYAGASGDFNPIHWSDRFAAQVGLPGVIAHGLLTMALVGRALADWAGNPAGIVDFNVRFTRPVLVPDTDEGAELLVKAALRQWTDEGYAVLDITATCAGEKVLSQARATVRPS
jgi:acyl dehydratase